MLKYLVDILCLFLFQKKFPIYILHLFMMSKYLRYITDNSLISHSEISCPTDITESFIFLSLQDTVVTVPPYIYVLDDPLDQCWYARHQLLFTCHLRPRDWLLPKRISDMFGEDDFRLELVFYTKSTRFYSTFEPLDLPGSGPMEIQGVPKFYERRPYSTWAPSQMVGGAYPGYPCFSEATLHRPSHTSAIT